MADYKKLIADLEKAINNLDVEIFNDRQTKGRYEFWQAHDDCKSLSYYKSRIIDALRKASLDEWFEGLSLPELEKVTGVKIEDYTDPDRMSDGLEDYVKACEKWWSKKAISNKAYIFNTFKSC